MNQKYSEKSALPFLRTSSREFLPNSVPDENSFFPCDSFGNNTTSPLLGEADLFAWNVFYLYSPGIWYCHDNSILFINGDEMTPVGQAAFSFFLDLSITDSPLREIHIYNFPLVTASAVHLFALMCANSESLETIAVVNCPVERSFHLNWLFSNYKRLVNFKISRSNLSYVNAVALLSSLPSTLQWLEISLAMDIPLASLNCILHKMNFLKTLILDGLNVIFFPWELKLSLPMHLTKIQFSNTQLDARFVSLLLPNRFDSLRLWHKANYSLNFPFNHVTHLNLSNTKIDISKLLDNCQFLELFPALEFIDLSGNCCTEDFNFSFNLIEKGIKIRFDYETIPLSLSNWFSYFAVSTKIRIDCSKDLKILNELLSQVENGRIKLDHVTHLKFSNCSITKHLEELFIVMDKLRNLQSISIDFLKTSTISVAMMPNVLSVLTVEHLVLNFNSNSNCEAIVALYLEHFSNVKTVEIHGTSKFDVTKLFPFHLFFLEKFDIQMPIDVAVVVDFFRWVSSLPATKALGFQLQQFTQHRLSFLRRVLLSRGSLKALPIMKLRRLNITIGRDTLSDSELVILFSKLPYLTELSLTCSSNCQKAIENLDLFRHLRKLEIGHQLNQKQLNSLANSIRRLFLLERVVCHASREHFNSSALQAAIDVLPLSCALPLNDEKELD